jgi:branched-chain amino acid transport system ATP-binding protein
MSTPLLKVTDLRAGYGRAEVLHGLSLEAAKGSVITVIGPNGAGKSTLLNALMGIIPGKGLIEFEGQSIQALTLEERVMQGIALVPEKRELFGTMSVEDNLVLGGYRQMQLGNAQWRSRIDDVFVVGKEAGDDAPTGKNDCAEDGADHCPELAETSRGGASGGDVIRSQQLAD